MDLTETVTQTWRAVVTIREVTPGVWRIDYPQGMWLNATGGSYATAALALHHLMRHNSGVTVEETAAPEAGQLRYRVEETVTLTLREALKEVLDMADGYAGEYGPGAAGELALEAVRSRLTP